MRNARYKAPPVLLRAVLVPGSGNRGSPHAVHPVFCVNTLHIVTVFVKECRVPNGMHPCELESNSVPQRWSSSR
jgi:hypothetical protein